MNKMYNTCPCRSNCVCLPVCRHKSWDDLVHNCSLILAYIDKHSCFDGVYHYRLVIERILKPTAWKLHENGHFLTWKNSSGTFTTNFNGRDKSLKVPFSHLSERPFVL